MSAKTPLDPTASRNRKPYVTPVLVEYGNIVMITRTAAGGKFDGGTGDDGIDDLSGTQ